MPARLQCWKRLVFQLRPTHDNYLRHQRLGVERRTVQPDALSAHMAKILSLSLKTLMNNI
jgi:hypothetical protein